MLSGDKAGGESLRMIWRAALILSLIGLGIGQAVAAEVNVYSSRHYRVDRELYREFTAATGIAVNVVTGKAGELIQRLRREGRNSRADLLYTVDAGNLSRAQSAGLLQPVRSPELEAILPAHLREPGGHWFGLTKRARVIMYHKDRVRPSELSSYEALGDPRWKGRILIRSSNNIYNQSLVAAMIAVRGAAATETWAKALVANMARRPKGGDRDQIRAVAAGEGDIAVANTYYLGRLATSNKAADRAIAAKIGVFFPNQSGRGTHVNVSGVGVTRHAPNRDAALRLIVFLLNADSQHRLAEANQEYPVRPGIESSATVTAWGKFKEDRINLFRLGENNSEAVRIMDRAGWR